MIDPLLTIAIPTFNRPKEILERVLELLPQLTPEVELLILDNHSEEVVEDLIRSNCNLQNKQVRFLRHPMNIGGAGNVCRCFEEAKASWMWMLGDDDRTDRAAVQNILAEISKDAVYENLAGFSCSTGIADHSEDTLIQNIEDLCDELRKPRGFSNLLFISSQIYNITIISNFIRFGYMAMSSSGPQLVILLRAIEDGAYWKLVRFRSVHYAPAISGTSWAPQQVSLGFPLLLDSIREVDKVSSALQESLPAFLSDLTLKRGMRAILLATKDSIKTSEIYYFRVSPYMKGTAFWRTIFLAIAARTLHCFPRIHSLLHKFIYKVLQIKKPLAVDVGRM